jgi:hypothetical protein
MRALIAGASGMVGNELLNLMLQSTNFTEVVSLVRKQSSQSNVKYSEVIIEWDNVLQCNLPDKLDVAFCCLGTTMKTAGSKEAFKKVDYEYAVNFAKLAHKHAIKCFVLISAMGADAQSSIFYNKVKGETEEAIAQLGFQSLYIMQPSLLLGNRKEKRVGEKIAMYVLEFLNPIMRGPLKKYAAIQGLSVAKSMCWAALQQKAGLHIFQSDQLHELAEKLNG